MVLSALVGVALIAIALFTGRPIWIVPAFVQGYAAPWLAHRRGELTSRRARSLAIGAGQMLPMAMAIVTWQAMWILPVFPCACATLWLDHREGRLVSRRKMAILAAVWAGGCALVVWGIASSARP